MSRKSSNTKRVMTVVGLPLVGLSMIPLYQFGRPWLNYHLGNWVVYDCKIQGDSWPVGAREDGRVENVFVTTGQSVFVGQLLARMNTQDLDSEEKVILAKIELARDVLSAEKLYIEKKIDSIASEEEYQRAKIGLAKKKSKANQMEMKWVELETNRMKKLADRGTVSKSELNQLLRELQRFQSKKEILLEDEVIAIHELSSWRAEIEQVKSRTAQVLVLLRKIKMAQAELGIIQEKRRAAEIRSRVSGTVSQVFRGPGSSVRVGDPIMQINSDRVWVEAWVDESNHADIQMGTQAEIQLKAFPNQKMSGIVKAFLPDPNRSKRSPQQSGNPVLQPDAKICVVLELDSNSMKLIPGLTGTVVFPKSNGVMDRE